MSERFYVNHPLVLGPLVLTGAEAHHLVHVCRIRVGAQVYLFNGDGKQYCADVCAAGKHDVTLEVKTAEKTQHELGYRLEVAAPLPRGDRAQFLVEKLTELGATDFVPLRTARSVVQPRAAHLEKLRRHVIEASKQCGRNVLLQVATLADWSTYIRRADLPAERILAHPAPFEFRVSSFEFRKEAGVALAVGPEGGFTEEEVDLARAAGWRTVCLGPRILRVETAALVLVALTNHLVTSPGGAG
jgi:16S rRNA (uracil1498-N3)-methyltransferase